MTLLNKIAFILTCTIVVVTTLAYGAVHQPIIALFYVAVTALVALWAIDGIKSRTVRFSGSLTQLPLIAACAYGLVQAFPLGSISAVSGVSGIPRTISLDPFATQVNALHFLALFFFLAITLVILDSASRIRKVAGLITVFGAVYAFFAILQSVLSPDKIYGIYERAFATPFGSFVSRHNFAAYMEMAAAIPLGLLFTGAVARDKRLLYVTAIGLMGTALLLSGSRGGLVAFVAEVVALLIFTMRSKSGNIVAAKIGLAALLLLAIIAGSFFVGGDTSLTRLSDTAAADEKLTDRAHIWKVSVEVVKHNLPFGAGLGAYGVAFTPHDGHSGLERVEQAHNDYLQVVSDAGIVGAILGIFFLFVLLRTGRSAINVENTYRRGIGAGAAAGIFAVLVHSIFDFVLHTTAISVLFLMLVALLTASCEQYNDDIDEQPGVGRDGRRRTTGRSDRGVSRGSRR